MHDEILNEAILVADNVTMNTVRSKQMADVGGMMASTLETSFDHHLIPQPVFNEFSFKRILETNLMMLRRGDDDGHSLTSSVLPGGGGLASAFKVADKSANRYIEVCVEETEDDFE